MILLDDQLYLPPLKEDKLQKVLDVGTGTGKASHKPFMSEPLLTHFRYLGNVSLQKPPHNTLLIFISEFADRFPNVEIVGTDLSPCQPEWVPPNVRFEIDDAVLNWTWEPNEFDFIHIRYLFGAIKDWTALFKEAYRCVVPGGWVQSAEADVEFRSDDGTVDLEPNLKLYTKLFQEGGKILNTPFFVYDLQVKAFEEAGFEEIRVVDHKVCDNACHPPWS